MRRDRHVVLLEELLVIHAGCLGPTARGFDFLSDLQSLFLAA